MQQHFFVVVNEAFQSEFMSGTRKYVKYAFTT